MRIFAKHSWSLFTLIITLSAASIASPSLAASKKDTMVNKLLPSINTVNGEITEKREKLIKLETKHKSGNLNGSDKTWLKRLAQDFNVSNPDFASTKTWQAMKLKVDVIPPSLAIAQAATESGWGSSRFAKVGNNYFGQSCFRRGCGIKPNTKFSHGYYEVQRFSSVDAAVRSYVNNLNTHRAYKQMRKIRQSARDKNQKPSGLSMAKGMTSYSERGQKYITYISSMMKSMQKRNLDQHVA